MNVRIFFVLLCFFTSISCTEEVKHVLVISIDGLYAKDLEKWIEDQPQSTLGFLSKTGVLYQNAYTTKPSDSIPASAAMFTGASPTTAGLYYDDAWHRKWGWIDLKEGIDINPLALDAGGGLCANKLPLEDGHLIYPHQMLRVNTVFEVLKKQGYYTAYSEKRPAYDFLHGPSGSGVDDLYVPEMAYANPKANDTLKNLSKTIAFDELRVQSILNQINGFDHSGVIKKSVPNLFGMNFQAVNSAKKFSMGSGYKDVVGTPNESLFKAIEYVDDSIARWIEVLNTNNLLENTCFIITAKHGESPFGNIREIVLTSHIPAILLDNQIAIEHITQKSSALIWLKDQNQVQEAVIALKQDKKLAKHLKEVLCCGDEGFIFPDPKVDPAVPDIVVVMQDGVNFEPSYDSITKAEHGGFGEYETHVPLLVARIGMEEKRVESIVYTKQIAPTILELFKLDPNLLEGVRKECTDVLPYCH